MRDETIPRRGKNTVERAGRIVEWFLAGLTMPQIGDRLGITRSRVQQIIAEVGVPSADGGLALRRAEREALRAERAARQAERKARRDELAAARQAVREARQGMPAKGDALVHPFGFTAKQWANLQIRTERMFGATVETMCRICSDPVVTSKRAVWKSVLVEKYIRARSRVVFAQHRGDYLSFPYWHAAWLSSGHLLDGKPEQGWCLAQKDPDKPWTLENARVLRHGVWRSKGGLKNTP